MGAFSRGKDRTYVPQVRLTGEPDSLNNHCSGGTRRNVSTITVQCSFETSAARRIPVLRYSGRCARGVPGKFRIVDRQAARSIGAVIAPTELINILQRGQSQDLVRGHLMA